MFNEYRSYSLLNVSKWSALHLSSKSYRNHGTKILFVYIKYYLLFIYIKYYLLFITITYYNKHIEVTTKCR